MAFSTCSSLGVLNADISTTYMENNTTNINDGAVPFLFSSDPESSCFSTGYLEDALIEFSIRFKRRRLMLCSETDDTYDHHNFHDHRYDQCSSDRLNHHRFGDRDHLNLWAANCYGLHPATAPLAYNNMEHLLISGDHEIWDKSLNEIATHNDLEELGHEAGEKELQQLLSLPFPSVAAAAAAPPLQDSSSSCSSDYSSPPPPPKDNNNNNNNNYNTNSSGIINFMATTSTATTPATTCSGYSTQGDGNEYDKSSKLKVTTTATKRTRVAYPFALVKPGGINGDITLNDINQRILMPPTRPVRHPVGDFACRPCVVSPNGPGLSGKAVVALTKIHTQGRGTITIIRTRG